MEVVLYIPLCNITIVTYGVLVRLWFLYSLYWSRNSPV